MLPFSIGFGELVVIVVVILLVVGPAKLPQIARTLGGALRMARRATRELQDAIQAEDLRQPLLKPWEEVVKARDEVMDAILADEPEALTDDQNAEQASDVNKSKLVVTAAQNTQSVTVADHSGSITATPVNRISDVTESERS